MKEDMGESFGATASETTRGIIQQVTSTNGPAATARDPMVMDKGGAHGREGRSLGAHPGYPDLMGFGRRKMTLSVDEIQNYMKYQIGALVAFTQSYGLKSTWRPGALGNLCQYDRETSRAICEAVYEIDPSIPHLLLRGGPCWGGGGTEDGLENGGGDLCRPRLSGGPRPWSPGNSQAP